MHKVPRRFLRVSSKPSLLFGLFFVVVSSSLVLAAAVVDRIPAGISVGPDFLPDAVPFDPQTLDALTCFAPTGERPCYEIAIPFGDWEGGPGAGVSQVVINGLPCRAFSVYSAGQAHATKDEPWVTQKDPQAKNVIILAKALWHNQEQIKAQVTIANVTRDFAGQAPPQGGLPEGTVHYESFALAEEVGLDRDHEPVEISVSVYPDEVATPEEQGGLAHELRLFRLAEEGRPEPVPIQIFDTGGVPGAESERKNPGYLYAPSQTARIFFFARVPAHQAVPYVITYGSASPPPAPAPPESLEIQGEAPGFTVSNAFYSCDLDTKSGQIHRLQMKGEGNQEVPVFTNSLTHAMHWNPDVYGVNGEWAHTFSWDPPDNIVIAAQGPLLFRITNSGPMPPATPQLYASVSYSFYAGLPYVGATTVTEVREPYSTSALRNGELVLDSPLVTHFVWKDKAGQINRTPTLVQAGVLDELTMMTEPDIPWVAMTHEEQGYGLAAIWTSVEAYHREAGTPPVHRPGFFFYSHRDWETPLTYFTRAWVYPFAYKGRRPNILLEPGAVYYEHGAFLPFRFEPGSDYETVERIDTLLRQPLLRQTGN